MSIRKEVKMKTQNLLYNKEKRNLLDFVKQKKKIMKQEDLKMLENLLWEFRVQYSDELSKSELRSIIEVIALLIIKVKK